MVCPVMMMCVCVRVCGGGGGGGGVSSSHESHICVTFFFRNDDCSDTAEVGGWNNRQKKRGFLSPILAFLVRCNNSAFLTLHTAAILQTYLFTSPHGSNVPCS